MLAVPFRFIVLLPILDEPAPAFFRAFAPLALDAILS
jgi:hypothetical protein